MRLSAIKRCSGLVLDLRRDHRDKDSVPFNRGMEKLPVSGRVPHVATVGSLRNGAVWPLGKNDLPLVAGVEAPLAAGLEPRREKTDNGAES